MKIKEFLKVQILSFLAQAILRVIKLTLRWKEVGLDGKERHWANGQPRIIAFWHNRQLFMPWIYLKSKEKGNARPMYCLSSRHGDGQIVGRVLKYMGVRSVAGSTSRGGSRAVVQLLRLVAKGNHIALTPDGPRGPVYKVKPGVIKLAQRSRAAIYPAAIGAEHVWTFNSWDKMILPKPFSKTVLIMGDPFVVPSELTEEEYEECRLKLENILNEISEKADNYAF